MFKQRKDATADPTVDLLVMTQMSTPEEKSQKMDTTTTTTTSKIPTCDSGNYSIASNSSDSSYGLELEQQSNYMRFQHMLREKDQALFLALQDVRKLRSELERLSKSEHWYKEELKSQKTTRIEALERLYTQERKYMQENQRLQRECVRLYAKCGEMENELEMQREKALEDLKIEARAHEASVIDESQTANNNVLNFELEQQRALISDQLELITVLRKQKRALLEDLRHLTEEKDEKVMELQQTVTSMEAENTRMTTKCKELIYERKNLKDLLCEKETTIECEALEKFKLQNLVTDLKEQLCAQEKILMQKEHEIIDLQKQFKSALKAETSADDVHRLSLAYKEEIYTKTLEISTLKQVLHSLQEELKSLNDLQTQNDAQERMIDQLNFKLETRQFELENLKQTDAAKSDQIAELQLNLESFRSERETALEQLFATQNAMKTMEKELICLNEQYANMCALCEHTKFELEMLQIEQSKLNFQTEVDKNEIELLREKLQFYLKQTATLSEQINTLETELEQKTAEKLEMERKLQNMEYNWRTENEKFKRTETLLIESETDLKELQEKIIEKDEKLLKLKAENVHLKTQEDFKQKELIDVAKMSLESKENYEKKLEELEALLQNNEYTIKNLQTENANLKQRERQNQLLENEAQTFKPIQLQLEIEPIQLQLAIDDDKQMLETIEELEELPSSKSITPDLYLQQDMEELSTSSQKLLENLNKQTELHVERTHLLDDFEDALERQTESYATPPDTPLKSLQAEAKVKQELLTLQQKLQEKIMECAHTNEQLQAQKEYKAKLREKLLINDAKLYKMEKLHERAEADEQVALELEKLKLENEQLMLVNKNAEENIKEQNKLLQSKEHIILQLKGKVKSNNSPMRIEASQSNTTALLSTLDQSICLDESTTREVLGLRAKVQELEAKLELSLSVDNEKREQRMHYINQLLTQQHDKMQQLNQSQAEWEELLKALNDTQTLEENTRKELELKRAELEELNELFADQNEELQKLQEITYKNECRRQEEFLQLQTAFQQEINVMQESYQMIVEEHKIQQCVIENLKQEIERMQNDFNEELGDEVTENKKQVRNLQSKLEKLARERDDCLIQMQELETEIYELKQNKRRREPHLVMPSLFRTEKEQANLEHEMYQNEMAGANGNAAGATAATDDVDDDNNDNDNDTTTDTDERLKLLSKVLELEYRRKMKRHEMHIHTLLDNVKMLKRTLKASELKATTLNQENAKISKELFDLQMAKRYMEEMRLKYEQSQYTIEVLKKTLDIERKKYEASDAGKAAPQQEEPVHEMPNLIDDYKKLLHQSAAATGRAKTSAIIDLIQRSNQMQPNFNNLETSIEDLRNDMTQFVAACKARRAEGIYDLNSSKAQKEEPSLMDELLEAEENLLNLN